MPAALLPSDGKWKVTAAKEEEVISLNRRTALQALDVALLAFARWRVADPSPSWILNGSKVFR